MNTIDRPHTIREYRDGEVVDYIPTEGSFKARVVEDDTTVHVILMNKVDVEYGRITLTGTFATPHRLIDTINTVLAHNDN